MWAENIYPSPNFNGCIISSHTSRGIWLLIHVEIEVKVLSNFPSCSERCFRCDRGVVRGMKDQHGCLLRIDQCYPNIVIPISPLIVKLIVKIVECVWHKLYRSCGGMPTVTGCLIGHSVDTHTHIYIYIYIYIYTCLLYTCLACIFNVLKMCGHDFAGVVDVIEPILTARQG